MQTLLWLLVISFAVVPLGSKCRNGAGGGGGWEASAFRHIVCGKYKWGQLTAKNRWVCSGAEYGMTIGRPRCTICTDIRLQAKWSQVAAFLDIRGPGRSHPQLREAGRPVWGFSRICSWWDAEIHLQGSRSRGSPRRSSSLSLSLLLMLFVVFSFCPSLTPSSYLFLSSSFSSICAAGCLFA